MEIKFNTYKYPSFGVYVSPKMKYTLFKETKKFYTRKEASKLLSLLENSSDKYSLERFEMDIPNKREKNIFCEIFIKSKLKSGKSCLIRTFLGKFRNRKIQYKPLEDIIKNLD